DGVVRPGRAPPTAFSPFGNNSPAGRSSVPDDGFAWQPTRQPVVLDAWPVTPTLAGGRFTTVMQWDSYPAREYGGRRFGMKSEAFGPYLDLPERGGRVFEVAVGGGSVPRALLRGRGGVGRAPRWGAPAPGREQGGIRGAR